MKQHGEENWGYMQKEGVREYIKLRPGDDNFMWPNDEEFRKDYSILFNLVSEVAFPCFERFAQYKNEKNESIILEEAIDDIRQLIPSRSSLSVIRYYSHNERPYKDVCSDHTDTGILTFVFRTQVPSLEILDKTMGKYVKVEELAEVGDMIVFLGEKSHLFTNSVQFCASPHRVNMVPNTERYSVTFLLDTAK
eukprot:TRINITY_DN5487_c0_g1_i1.p1 TRINITY_DN5487_c0_g1~~TRINITY_DN5487_c0_g1_i1.p1  ORF type:complete len:193 (-),score=28.84 TRINITY_DN5487_c0_g1_i1:551-1129(-)